MKLMCPELKKCPPLNSDDEAPLATKLLRVKFFDPSGSGTWYVTEFDGEDLCFGYVVSPLGESAFNEWGLFSLKELQSIGNRFGLGIERDLHFTPKAFAELRAQ